MKKQLCTKVLYADRVIVYCRDMPRDLPSIIGWTCDLVRERSLKEIRLGGSGRGFVDNPLHSEEPKKVKIDIPSVSKSKDTDKVDTSPPEDVVEEYATKVLSKLTCLASDVVSINVLLQGVPKEVLNDTHFGRIHDVARKLIRLSFKEKGTPQTYVPEEMSEVQQNEAFWNNPETIEAIEKIEEAVGKRNESYRKVTKMPIPSFSLGLTQDECNINSKDVVQIAKDREEEVNSKVQDHSEIDHNVYSEAHKHPLILMSTFHIRLTLFLSMMCLTSINKHTENTTL